jgi:hypothetical protein
MILDIFEFHIIQIVYVCICICIYTFSIVFFPNIILFVVLFYQILFDLFDFSIYFQFSFSFYYFIKYYFIFSFFTSINTYM